MSEVILTSNKGYFQVIKGNRVVDDKIIDTYKVISIDAADKHVVEIRHEYDNSDIIKADYTRWYIAHGMRCTQDTLADIKEYIEVLEDALEFVPKIIHYFEELKESCR